MKEVNNHSMQILMAACNNIGHEQFTQMKKKEIFKATVPIKGYFAQSVTGMPDNSPRETEGVASPQSWTQHLFQELGCISARTGPECKYLWFPSYTIYVFCYSFILHGDSTAILSVHSRLPLESINTFLSS